MSQRDGACDVLLVEDDRDIRLTIADILGDEGYRVATADSGSEALAVIETCTPRLILLDLMMPGMNGWEFQARLQATPAWRNIPVILLSGGRDLAHHATASKATGYLEKPINLQQLLDTVDKYCPLARL